VADGPVNPPSIVNYPSAVAVVVIVVFTALLLFVAGRYDPTKGVLTISIMIVLGMLGATAYCLVFTIPNDDITPGVVGALSAGFGAVLTYWLGRAAQGGPPPHD
jgi:uncharacterized RDD family membrane protein YckC